MGRALKIETIPHRQYIRRTRLARMRRHDSNFMDFLARASDKIYSNLQGTLDQILKRGEFFPFELLGDVNSIVIDPDALPAYEDLPGAGTTFTVSGSTAVVANASATFVTDGFVAFQLVVYRITGERFLDAIMGTGLLFGGPVTETEMTIFMTGSNPFQENFTSEPEDRVQVAVFS